MNDNKHDEKDNINKQKDSITYTYCEDYSYIKNTFGEKLLQLRKEKGVNQNEMAKALGISRVALSYYERGERTADIEILIKAAKAFGVSPNYLLGEGARKVENDHLSLYNVFSENVANFLIGDHHRLDFLDAILSHKDMEQLSDLIYMTHYKPLVNEYEINYFSFMLSQLLYSIITDVGKEAYKFKALNVDDMKHLLNAIDEYKKLEKEHIKNLENPDTISTKGKLQNTTYDITKDKYDEDNWWALVENTTEKLDEIYTRIKSLLNK